MTFATRDELNGLGARVNEMDRRAAAYGESIETSKTDRRDLWNAVAAGREEDKRIERTVNQVSVRVAGIQAVTLILQAALFWYFTHKG